MSEKQEKGSDVVHLLSSENDSAMTGTSTDGNSSQPTNSTIRHHPSSSSSHSPSSPNKSVKITRESSPHSPATSRSTAKDRKSINGGNGKSSPSSSPNKTPEKVAITGRRNSTGDISSDTGSPGSTSAGSPSASRSMAKRKSTSKRQSGGATSTDEPLSLASSPKRGANSSFELNDEASSSSTSLSVSDLQSSASGRGTQADSQVRDEGASAGAADMHTSGGVAGMESSGNEDDDLSGDISAASSGSVPLALSATLSRGAYHQCGTARRVKVYELKGETWFDRGTGYCAGVYDEHNDAALLVARMEETCRRLTLGSNGTDEQPLGRPPESTGDDEHMGAEGREDREHYVLVVSENLDSDDLLLKARVVKEDVYQRQQDTLVVWTEPDGTDMALSFQEADGCHEVWEFLTEVQKHFLLSANGGTAEGFDLDDADGTGMLGMSAAAAAAGMTTTEDDLMMADGTPFALPDPPLMGNLHLIDMTLKDAANRSPQAREKVAEWILREEYIIKLIPIFQDAEELEQLESLHRLCAIMHTIIMLNDNVLMERMLRDDTFLGVVGMLEYDPEFPKLKASYREYLTNTARFRQVVPIPDPMILAKIHQTFRLQYLKDVILARTIDDSTFAVLNSLIFYHQADIVIFCSNSEALLSSLFQLFEPNRNESEGKKAEAIIFLQQLCAIGKQVQLPSRIALYRTLTEWGLLIVLEYALTRIESRLRNAAAEILMSIIEYDASGVRSHILEQVDKKSSLPPLITKLASILHEPEGDLGLKTQIAESMRILFDSSLDGSAGGPIVAQTLAAAAASQSQDENSRKDDTDRFLNWFYDGEVDVLFRPLKELTSDSEKSKDISVNPVQSETKEASTEKRNEGKKYDLASLQKDDKEGEIVARHFHIASASKSAMLNHLCELLTFVMIHHQFRSQYWVISSDIGIQVATLLFAREKHLRLAALRFFRACLAKGNQFINRHFVKIGLLGAILSVIEGESTRDNLVTSACLEFFEHIRKEPVKPLINHLFEKYESRVRALTQHATIGHYFQAMILQWEKSNAEQSVPTNTTMEASLSNFDEAEKERKMRDLSRRGENRAIMDSDEEDYFNEEDEEEDAADAKVELPPLGAVRKRSGSGATPYVSSEIDQGTSGHIEVSSEEREEEGMGDFSGNDASIGHHSITEKSVEGEVDIGENSVTADDSMDTSFGTKSTKRKKREGEDEEGEDLKLGRVTKRQSSDMNVQTNKANETLTEKSFSGNGDGGVKKMSIKLKVNAENNAKNDDDEGSVKSTVWEGENEKEGEGNGQV